MTDAGGATEQDDLPFVKACPFCGSLAAVLADMRVMCGSCGASGPFGVSTAEAIRNWNKRVTTEGPAQR